MRAVAFRLSENDVELVKSYARKHGIAQAEAIRIAIRKLDGAIRAQGDASTREEEDDKETGKALSALVRQLAAKDDQIANLGRALESAQETAKAAQALHASSVHERALESGDQKKRSRWRWPWRM